MSWRLPLAAEIALAAILAVAATNILTFSLVERAGDEAVRAIGIGAAADRTIQIATLLQRVDPSERQAILAAATARGESFRLAPEPRVGGSDGSPVARILGARLASEGYAGAAIRVRALETAAIPLPPPPPAPPEPPQPPHGAHGFSAPPAPRSMPLPPDVLRDLATAREGQVRIERTSIAFESIELSVPLAGLGYLNAVFRAPQPPSTIVPLASATAAGALALALAGLWLGYRLGRPLRSLRDAADTMRRGEPAAPVAEQGPREIAAAAAAFNAMSERTTAVLAEQRALLAAVAHDLRTPITALRLRLEMLPESETRARMAANLDELQGLAEAVLDASSAAARSEAARSLDLRALAEAIVEDERALGGAAEFTGGPAPVATVRPGEVRRILRNLVGNALRYGGSADVSTAIDGREAVVRVADRGPGLSADERARAFDPFWRAETSRAKETGGHGLGLTIARALARGHGGDVALKPNPGGGLIAELRLPLGQAAG